MQEAKRTATKSTSACKDLYKTLQMSKNYSKALEFFDLKNISVINDLNISKTFTREKKDTMLFHRWAEF